MDALIIILTIVGLIGTLVSIYENWLFGAIMFLILMSLPIAFVIRKPMPERIPTVKIIVIHHTNETVIYK